MRHYIKPQTFYALLSGFIHCKLQQLPADTFATLVGICSKKMNYCNFGWFWLTHPIYFFITITLGVI